MSMKLTVNERMMILTQLFPREADFVGVRAMKAIRKKIDLDTKEMDAIGFKQVPDPMNPDFTYFKWDEKKAKDRVVDFDSVETTFLKTQVSRLDSERKITEAAFDLCERINALP